MLQLLRIVSPVVLKMLRLTGISSLGNVAVPSKYG